MRPYCGTHALLVVPRECIYKSGMDKKHIAVAVVAAIILAVVAMNFRYEVTPAGNGIYKTDRWTGQTVHIIGNRLNEPKAPKPNFFDQFDPPAVSR